MGIRAPDRTKIFLFVADKKIVGLLLAEQISQGFQIIPPTEGEQHFSHQLTKERSNLDARNNVLKHCFVFRRREETGVLLLRDCSASPGWHLEDMGACRLQVSVGNEDSIMAELNINSTIPLIHDIFLKEKGRCLTHGGLHESRLLCGQIPRRKRFRLQ